MDDWWKMIEINGGKCLPKIIQWPQIRLNFSNINFFMRITFAMAVNKCKIFLRICSEGTTVESFMFRKCFLVCAPVRNDCKLWSIHKQDILFISLDGACKQARLLARPSILEHLFFSPYALTDLIDFILFDFFNNSTAFLTHLQLVGVC